MNLLEYVKLSAKTCPDLGSHEDNLLHMSIGIKTEMGEIMDAFKKNFAYKKELDKVNVAEEIGDTSWYAAGIIRLMNLSDDKIIKLSNLIFNNPYTDIDKLENTKHALQMLDHNIGTTGIIDLFLLLVSLAKYIGYDYFAILDTNIAKLKARYGDKFSEEKAINRDLETERKILES